MKKIAIKILIGFFCGIFFQSQVYAAEKITVLLDWFLNPDHAPLFVAQQKGFFAQQNLDVTLIGPADSSDPPKLVAAGKADIAIDYEPQFIQQVKQGLPLARIGVLIDQPLNCLAILKESPIHSVQDLKGKRIGHSSGEINSILLKTMLQKNGLQLSDIQSIDVHYNLSQALLSKKVDAVTGVMRNFETIQMELNGHPVRTFYPEKNGMPTYEELIFVVNKDKINDPRWKRFLIAVKQGNDYLQKHPNLMWKTFVKIHPELNDELNRRAWYVTLPYFAKDPAEFNAEQWKKFTDFMEHT